MCSVRVITSFIIISTSAFLPLCVNHHVSSAVFHGYKRQHRPSDVLSRDYSDYPEMYHKIDILTLVQFSYLVKPNVFMTVGKQSTGSLEMDRDSDRRALEIISRAGEIIWPYTKDANI